MRHEMTKMGGPDPYSVSVRPLAAKLGAGGALNVYTIMHDMSLVLLRTAQWM